jgi:hypothetical protein
MKEVVKENINKVLKNLLVITLVCVGIFYLFLFIIIFGGLAWEGVNHYSGLFWLLVSFLFFFFAQKIKNIKITNNAIILIFIGGFSFFSAFNVLTGVWWKDINSRPNVGIILFLINILSLFFAWKSTTKKII